MKQAALTFRPFAANRKITAVLALAFAVFLALLVAPLAVLLLVDLSDTGLARVGNIGQAYGAISALLSALALASVASSLFYQARQDRAHRIGALRQGQRDLLAYAIAEPSVFAPCFLDSTFFASDDEARRYLFTTMWLSYCRQGYETGVFNEEDVRVEFASEMFASPVALELWTRRVERFKYQGVEDTGPFYRIFEREYANHVRVSGGVAPDLAPPVVADEPGKDSTT